MEISESKRKKINTEAVYATMKLVYVPNIIHPRTFNEYILHNKFFCRDPLLVETTDKVAVNDYVKRNGLENILIHNYFITDNPVKIPFDKLPHDYIIKPNQLSGSLVVVRKGKVDRNKVIALCRDWLKITHYGASRFVWCTSLIKPQIIVQELIDDNPVDYKFHMINGKCAFIGIYSADSIGVHPRRNINYDCNWNMLPFRIQYEYGNKIQKPEGLDKMIEIAERLSKPFNYVRVDLYNIKGRIYFGELTHFPNSGSGRFIPDKYDWEYGKLFTV